jgi:iron complex outermembrane receptor protein
MKRFYLASVAVGALLAVGAASPAGAQSAGAGGSGANAPSTVPSPGSYNSSARNTTRPSGQLETIVVTAQKRSERLQNVPVAVTAISAKQMQETHFTDVSDLQATVPNLELSVGAAGPGSGVISLRGLSFQDIEKSFEPPIGVVLDGVYLATSTGMIAQAFDFNSVEVLAGPQGTLFGKNTTGGVINITRSKPNPMADKISGQIELTGGNFGEHDGSAVVNVPVIHDILAMKFAAFSQNNDGPFKDPTIGHNIGARDYQAYSVAADYRPNADSDVYLIFDRVLDHSQLYPTISAATPDTFTLPVGGFVDGGDAPCLNPFLPGACPNGNGKAPSNVATQDGLPKSAYNLYAGTLNAYYNFPDFKLVDVAGYRSEHEDSFNDYDATDYYLYNTQRPQYYRQTSDELRLESNFTGPFNIVVGAFFFDSFYHLTQTSQLDVAAVAPIPPGLVELYPGSYAAQHSLNEALFFQGTYDFNSQWRLIFGGRQSWDQKHIDLQLTTDPNDHTLGYVNCPSNTPGQAYCESVGASHAWSQFTPKIGVQYRINPNAMAYLTYTKGYNSGGFNGRAGDVELVGPYAPEQVHSFELGAKTTWFDNRLRVDGDVFWTIFNNAQEEIIKQIGNLTSTTVANSAFETFRGAELEVAGKPTPDWTVSANVGYLDAYYTSFTASLLQPAIDPATGQLAGTSAPTNNSGLTIRRTPPWTVGANSDYVVPLQNGDLGFDANLKFVAHQQFDLLNDPRGFQGPVTKLDLSARYERPFEGLDWSLTGFVKNLTNATPKNTFVTGYQGSFVEFWSEEVGRTYGVTLSVKF